MVFERRDVDLKAREMRARKVPLLAGPADRPEWGIRTIHVRDPDGYVVEIVRRLPSWR